MCDVCATVPALGRRCLLVQQLRKPVRKPVGVGAPTGSPGVVRKKSNMGVGRPVGIGWGRGHPRCPKPIWGNTWKICTQASLWWALVPPEIPGRKVENFLCCSSQPTLLWKCGRDEGAVRRRNMRWAGRRSSNCETKQNKGQNLLSEIFITPQKMWLRGQKAALWGNCDPCAADQNEDWGGWQD